MNREQKRNYIKIAKKKGIGEEYARAYIALKESEESDMVISSEDIKNIIFDRKAIKDGDKVLINVDKITSNKNYSKMLEEYREFIENSNGVIYTAKVEKEHFVSLEENPKWLFFAEDLIVHEKSSIK